MPAFARIADALRAEIAAGALPPGGQIPPMGALARRFGTTVLTVRRALRDLESEGLVEVRHGSGCYVADWGGGYDLPRLPSFPAALAGAGAAETRVLARRRGVTAAEAARALELDPATPLAVLERVRAVEGRPVAYQRSYLAEELWAAVEACGKETPLYEAIRARSGRIPVRAEETLQAAPLPADAARRLQAEPGAPGFRSLRLTRDAAGRPLVYDEAWLPGDRVELRLPHRAGADGIEYVVRTGSEQGRS